MKRSALLILALTLFIDLLGFGLIIPLIPVYIRSFGGAPWVGGMLLACYSLMQFIFAPIWGRMSDKHGRRPIILVGLIGSACAFLAFGLSNTLILLFIARVAAGGLTAATIPTAQAYIADVTTPEKRSGGMAILGVAFGLGFAFGPVIGGYAVKFSIFHLPPLATPALIAAGLSFFNFIWAFFMLPESHHEETRKEIAAQEAAEGGFKALPAIANALKSPTIGAQLTVFAIVTFAFTAVESSFSWLVILRFKEQILLAARNLQHSADPSVLWNALSRLQQTDWVEKAQAATTSHIFLIVGMTALVVQGMLIRGLTRVINEHLLVRIGAGLLTLTLFGIAFAHTLPFLYLLSAATAISTSLLNPPLAALITESAGPRERGTLSGIQQGLGSMARVIAPPINNYFVGIQTAIPFISSAFLMLIGFFLSFRIKPMLHQRKGKSESPAGSFVE